MSPRPAKEASPSGVQKHRACDECRSRKLACSKEPDGCSRCRREGILCHYSPQKPMGRPRKRRQVEDASPPRDAPVADDFVDVSGPDVGVSSGPGYDFQQGLEFDPSLSFLDQPIGSGMDFFDLLPNPYHDPAVAGPMDQSQHTPPIYITNQDHYDGGAYPLKANGANLFEGLNFDEPDPSVATVSKHFGDSLQRYMASQYSLDAPESTPSDLSTSVPSPEPPAQHPPPPPSVKPVPTVSCGCLSSLYLALDSLTHLPPGVAAAMRVARAASRVAHDAVACPHCSRPLFSDPRQPPPIQGFQNMMLLGALLPSACNAYAAILEMVDAEAARAADEGCQLFFSFRDLGGLWGGVAAAAEDAGHQRAADPSLAALRGFDNRSMPPDMWRTAIRAVMRLDVYGLGEVSDRGEGGGGGGGGGEGRPSHLRRGLKDVIAMLDERSRRRHDLMDEMIASGQMPKHSPYVLFPGGVRPVPHDQRNCVRILETARRALDNLVIA